MIKDRLIRAGGAVLDLVYPPDLYCICCGKIIDGTRTYRLCDDCMEGVKWVSGRTCSVCGKPLSEMNPGDICFSCREHSHVFRRGFACAEYGTHERAVVFSLKYDGRSDIAETVGEIMYDRMTAEFEEEELRDAYSLILPVPVHSSRRAARGYNQAALIAGSFARRCGIRMDDNILFRKKQTEKMKALTPDARRENIRGAFGIRSWRVPDIAGQTILLIDDIYTTGATVDEIAGVLKDSGAREVDVLTFAAGADMVKG